ncbi:MAG: hypothetical protein IJ679_01745, partial [Lachnospiraceae bacterium]|nr:hypothetical protein [Lachnospiraceae bacterium]
KQQVNALQIERDTINLKVAEIHGMESEMQDLKAKGVVASRMPSYNASNEELDFLHLILGATSDYYIDFTDVTREGDQIRRNFSLQYRTSNYKTALQVLDQLENSEIRCRIGDLSVSPSGESNNIMNGPVQVSVQATFFETMQGGEADAELPEDSAVNEEVGE